MKFQVLSVAELEAVDAAIWYDDQRFGLGSDFLAELERAFDRIRNAPQSFPSLEYYAGPHEIRRCALGRFPYLVVFRHRPGELLVIAVSHVRRQPLYWLKRLG